MNREGSIKSDYILMKAQRDAALAEMERLVSALERIGHPNYSAKATPQDARDMASYAREILRQHKRQYGDVAP